MSSPSRKITLRKPSHFGSNSHPSPSGKASAAAESIGARGGSKGTVIDGPFTESKELVAGFWIWQVKSLDEAIEWIKRAPFDGGVEIQLRPIFEAEDFGKELTPELRAKEEKLRAEAAKLAKK